MQVPTRKWVRVRNYNIRSFLAVVLAKYGTAQSDNAPYFHNIELSINQGQHWLVRYYFLNGVTHLPPSNTYS